jgi:UDP-N-acetylglucosamine--N-acetylmuramyl-(pentapeptide) pyrophosphoryl-undecaprenol N-acetylglucosamine transferase
MKINSYKKTVLISAAKTGGHLIPALEVSKKLINENHKVIFIGGGYPLEKELINELNVLYIPIKMVEFRGANIFKKLKLIYLLPKNIIRLIFILIKNKVSTAITFGGFISIPVGMAAKILNKRLYIHEQNSIMGSANKLLYGICTKAFVGIPLASSKYQRKIILTGNPIRQEFYEDAKYLNKNDDELNIYITGGSQGSLYINNLVPLMLNEISCEKINIIHQCGFARKEEVQERYDNLNINAEVKEFVKNPAKKVAWSDFVITRCGALSLSEIISMNKGMIMIPLSSSIDNHQLYNAKFFRDNGSGEIFQESEEISSLIARFKEIIRNKRYKDWQKDYSNTRKATEIIYEHII